MTLSLPLILQYLPALAHGFLVTLLAWLLGTAGAFVLGLAIAVVRLAPGRWASVLAGIYIEVIRGTPFPVQLFIVYYGGPFVGLDQGAGTIGIVCLAAYGSPYFAEICRGSFKSVPRGQTEAAMCLGLGQGAIIWYVMLPQMLTVGLPSFVNIAIVMIKETAVLSVITVPELTFQVSGMGSDTFAFAECYLVLALAYWGLTEATSALGSVLERRASRYLSA